MWLRIIHEPPRPPGAARRPRVMYVRLDGGGLAGKFPGLGYASKLYVWEKCPRRVGVKITLIKIIRKAI